MTEPINFSELAEQAVETDPITPTPYNGADLGIPTDPEEKQSFVRRVLIGDGPTANHTTENKRKKPKAPPPPKPRTGQLVKPLTDLYVTIGTIMMPFDSVCGGAIIASAPKCAEAVENLARENPAIRRAVLALVETSVWGQVIAAHAPIFVAIAVHHVPAVKNGMATMAGKITAEDAERFLNQQQGPAE